MKKDVTVVITSSDRHDLLERTLDSFVRFNTYEGIRRIIVVEDSYSYPHFLENNEKYAGYDIYILNHRPRLGQLLAIDVAYKYVDTEYIFHCEDDWEFYTPGFIETSLPIIDSAPNILQVHLRRLDDVFTKGPLDYSLDPSGKFALINEGSTSYAKWYGFSFNPGLRRLSHYRELGCYSPQLLTPRYKGEHFENYIGLLCKEMGLVAAVNLFNQGSGFVRHLGDKRHVF